MYVQFDAVPYGKDDELSITFERPEDIEAYQWYLWQKEDAQAPDYTAACSPRAGEELHQQVLFFLGQKANGWGKTEQ